MVRNASEGVIGISKNNSHYFFYKGKEVLLITSAEHYGAVVNARFDYVKYLDALAEYGLNYTRIYPGAMIEKVGSWLPEDTLAPGADLIVPWARADEDGYICGGKKFDLDTWDPAYFARLRDFLAQAAMRNIIVEICFFNCQYETQWPYSPLYKGNNIQGVGNCHYNTCQTLDNAPLAREHLRYVEKLIVETNDFDNIIYEFVDEPTLFEVPSRKAWQWISALIDKAIETEDKLPKKHLLAQQQELGINFGDDDRTGLIVTQYIITQSRQVGGIDALNNFYGYGPNGYGKPIELNETAYIPSWIPGESLQPPLSRLEAWEFMVGGGAGFNQLNGYFLPSNPGGDLAVNKKLLQGLRNLRAFLEGFDFAKMRRDLSVVKGSSVGASVNGISEKGRQYALYMHHSFPCFGGGTWYWPSHGEYETKLTIRVERGRYTLTFVEPETLKVLARRELVSDGEDMEITCPRYTLDIAVKIVAVDAD